MSTLIEQVQELNSHYEENKDTIQENRQKELEEKRKAARAEALGKITENCVDNIKQAASGPGRKDGSPRMEAKLFEWKFSEDMQFNGCYLRDLLNKGNLLEELQEWFDKNHPGSDGNRVFKVYYTMMGGPNVNRRAQDRRYAIFVSWDQEDWDRIDQLIQRTKERFDPNTPRPTRGPRNFPRGQPRNYGPPGGYTGGPPQGGPYQGGPGPRRGPYRGSPNRGYGGGGRGGGRDGGGRGPGGPPRSAPPRGYQPAPAQN